MPSPAEMEHAVRAAVLASGGAHEFIECDPALADTDAFCRHYGYPPEQSANTIIVASRKPPGLHAACVVLATSRLDVNNRVRRLLGARKVSFAPPELSEEISGMALGGVTPFALPDGLPIYVDAAIGQLDWVIVGGGSRSLKVKVSPDGLLALPDAVSIEGLATPAA